MAAKARGMLFLEVKESHKESEDVVAMSFFGICRLLEKNRCSNMKSQL